LVVPFIGNTYSGSCLIGLAATLDVARPGERIFVTSFGSGAGSDAFSISVKDKIEDIRAGAPSVRDYIGKAQYLDYAIYAKHKGKLKL
jgi:hydroxymethylglutaryl-CoA synthase